MTLEAIKYKNGILEILDQLLLPAQTVYIPIRNVEDGFRAIKTMQVRGAPAIAIVGCLSLVVELKKTSFDSKDMLRQTVKEKLGYLLYARPTAVNIKTAAKELNILLRKLIEDEAVDVIQMKEIVMKTIEAMLEKDIADNKAIGDFGAREILSKAQGDNLVSVLTHCNTGSLATAGYGTALGIIRSLYTEKRLERAYCTETRPYNQGARLTAYELVYENIPATLICDNMVGALMKTKKIDAVVVGADRVAANGDTANKIGTYQIAVLAKYHNVPFYVAAPFTSIDLRTLNGDEIEIEERPEDEMTTLGGQRIAAEGISCWNPAFDVTPAALITAIVTEKGVFKPEELKQNFSREHEYQFKWKTNCIKIIILN